MRFLLRYIPILIISILPFDFSHADGVILTSPFFITNPIHPITKETGKRKYITRKPFDVLNNYETVQKGKSITLYKHKTSELYIQKIDLSSGMRIGSISESKDWESETGEPLFGKQTVGEQLKNIKNPPFSLINGQFFDPKRDPTPLSFGVKIDGIIQTVGADNRKEKKNILSVSEKSAQIIPYSWENFRDAPGYFVMVNLSPDQPHYREEEIGRTSICLAHPDSSNQSSELIILSAQSLTEPFAEKELLRWSCTHESITKLDASGSTRIYFQGKTVYGNSHRGSPDARRIPHAIVFFDL